MQAERLIAELEASTEMIRSALAGLSAADARRRPAPESWSVLEVLCHLLDEERLDFRARLDLILHRPNDPWAPIDPRGWVSAHGYNEQDFGQVAADFFGERARSLEWLRSLQSPDWERSAPAPWGAPMRAADMFAAWVAHDNLHLRQLIELRRAHIEQLTAPADIQYAGEWQQNQQA